MKKISVIGCPGSGKSSFARALHAKTGIPLYYLDMMFWNHDKTTVDRSVFLERLGAVMDADEWIIDGNYASTMELRLAACDTVFFLDYPTQVCLAGIRARRGTERPDMPWVETEEDPELTKCVESFPREQRPLVYDLLKKYGEKNIYIFKSREEANAYLNG